MRNNRQAGYTVTEILIALWFVFCMALMGASICVAYHFISKYW